MIRVLSLLLKKSTHRMKQGKGLWIQLHTNLWVHINPPPLQGFGGDFFENTFGCDALDEDVPLVLFVDAGEQSGGCVNLMIFFRDEFFQGEGGLLTGLYIFMAEHEFGDAAEGRKLALLS